MTRRLAVGSPTLLVVSRERWVGLGRVRRAELGRAPEGSRPTAEGGGALAGSAASTAAPVIGPRLIGRRWIRGWRASAAAYTFDISREPEARGLARRRPTGRRAPRRSPRRPTGARLVDRPARVAPREPRQVEQLMVLWFKLCPRAPAGSTQVSTPQAGPQFETLSTPSSDSAHSPSPRMRTGSRRCPCRRWIP